MVRVKFRYIAIRIQTFPSTILSQESYKKIIYDLVFEEYGLKIALYMYSFTIIELLQSNNICIFKIVRDASIPIVQTLKNAKFINKYKCQINVLAISGSVRKIMKKSIVVAKNETN